MKINRNSEYQTSIVGLDSNQKVYTIKEIAYQYEIAPTLLGEDNSFNIIIYIKLN